MSSKSSSETEECDEHKWEIKAAGGHGNSGNNFNVVLQCMNCGMAKRERISNDGVFYDGWEVR